MKNKSLLIGLCNKILLLIAFGFFARQLFVNSFIENYFPIRQSLKRGDRSSHNVPHKSVRNEKEMDTPGNMASNQEKLDAEIDLLDFKLMPLLGSDENLSNDDLKKLNKIFADLEKIKDDAQRKHIAGLINEKINRLEKQIIICKQATASEQKK